MVRFKCQLVTTWTITPAWQASIGEEAHFPLPASQNSTVKPTHCVECGPLFETAALGTGKQEHSQLREPEEVVSMEEDHRGDYETALGTDPLRS